MARPKKSEEQESLFVPEPLYVLKLGVIDVPYVEEGKGGWRKVTQAQWNREHQNAIMKYWEQQKVEHPKFDIQAKMNKLFVMSEPEETSGE